MPTRQERLADHFIRAAGIAAVHVDATGAIGADDGAGMFGPADRTVYCCAAGNQAKVAALAAARTAPGSGYAAALAAVHAAAAEAGVGLTPFSKVVQRAFAAVEVVETQIAEMQRAGDLKDLNRDFKAARAADTKLRYHDYLHVRKAAMLEALAIKSSGR
jgi:hypothetical protein